MTRKTLIPVVPSYSESGMSRAQIVTARMRTRQLDREPPDRTVAPTGRHDHHLQTEPSILLIQGLRYTLLS